MLPRFVCNACDKGKRLRLERSQGLRRLDDLRQPIKAKRNAQIVDGTSLQNTLHDISPVPVKVKIGRICIPEEVVGKFNHSWSLELELER